MYENWTDVSGFLVTDPRIVKNPEVIESITYRELRELSYMGATVLHEDAIFPVRKEGIPINIKNTNRPEDKGTFIVESTCKKPKFTITGIAGKKGFCSINIEKSMMNSEIGKVVSMREDELFEEAKNLRVPYELVEYVHKNGRLPVVNFAAGGVATPADAALMMQLGAEGVFVGSGIFKSGDPAKRAAAIVKAVTNYTDAKLIAELSTNLGEAMVGINENEIALLMAERGK